MHRRSTEARVEVNPKTIGVGGSYWVDASFFKGLATVSPTAGGQDSFRNSMFFLSIPSTLEHKYLKFNGS